MHQLKYLTLNRDISWIWGRTSLQRVFFSAALDTAEGAWGGGGAGGLCAHPKHTLPFSRQMHDSWRVPSGKVSSFGRVSSSLPSVFCFTLMSLTDALLFPLLFLALSRSLTESGCSWSAAFVASSSPAGTRLHLPLPILSCQRTNTWLKNRWKCAVPEVTTSWRCVIIADHCYSFFLSFFFIITIFPQIVPPLL